ncbi:uncharacterized protein [Oscarella lobularis]|uniref:uncharacterized protein n=1 Tax=Oscarella lobularis TaxID=121494 RepID=UPI003313BC89
MLQTIFAWLWQIFGRNTARREQRPIVEVHNNQVQAQCHCFGRVTALEKETASLKERFEKETASLKERFEKETASLKERVRSLETQLLNVSLGSLNLEELDDILGPEPANEEAEEEAARPPVVQEPEPVVQINRLPPVEAAQVEAAAGVAAIYRLEDPDEFLRAAAAVLTEEIERIRRSKRVIKEHLLHLAQTKLCNPHLKTLEHLYKAAGGKKHL